MVRHEGESSFNRGAFNANPVNVDDAVLGRPMPLQRHGCHCISDKCMMWRWEGEWPKFLSRAHPQKTALRDDPDTRVKLGIPANWDFWAFGEADDGDACWMEPASESLLRRHGFCGLAGRPEVLS